MDEIMELLTASISVAILVSIAGTIAIDKIVAWRKRVLLRRLAEAMVDQNEVREMLGLVRGWTK